MADYDIDNFWQRPRFWTDDEEWAYESRLVFGTRAGRYYLSWLGILAGIASIATGDRYRMCLHFDDETGQRVTWWPRPVRWPPSRDFAG